MKEVFAPHLGRNVKIGGLKPRRPGELHLHFSDFVTHSKLPTIPSTFDFSNKATVPLKDIYGNDQLGDCAVAMIFHAAALFTGNATGAPYHATSSQIVSAYSKISGYVPGDSSTDNGCVMTDVFRYWKNTGLSNGEKILDYVSVNAANFADVLAAAFLFENLCFGVGLPDSYVDPFPNGDGFFWRKGIPDPSNGHAFLGIGGIASGANAGIKIDTWGLFGTFTPDAIASEAGPSGGGELYSVITTDILAKGQQKAPNGVAWTDLIQAFNSFGGGLPVPPPAPVHQPALTDVQAWASKGLATSYKPGMTLKQAEAAATTGIAVNWPQGTP